MLRLSLQRLWRDITVQSPSAASTVRVHSRAVGVVVLPWSTASSCTPLDNHSMATSSSLREAAVFGGIALGVSAFQWLRRRAIHTATAAASSNAPYVEVHSNRDPKESLIAVVVIHLLLLLLHLLQCASGVLKSPADPYDYRCIKLDNGLSAMLVHDDYCDAAAAALDICIGSGSDPLDVPGLAHFLEVQHWSPRVSLHVNTRNSYDRHWTHQTAHALPGY